MPSLESIILEHLLNQSSLSADDKEILRDTFTASAKEHRDVNSDVELGHRVLESVRPFLSREYVVSKLIEDVTKTDDVQLANHVYSSVLPKVDKNVLVSSLAATCNVTGDGGPQLADQFIRTFLPHLDQQALEKVLKEALDHGTDVQLADRTFTAVLPNVSRDVAFMALYDHLAPEQSLIDKTFAKLLPRVSQETLAVALSGQDRQSSGSVIADVLSRLRGSNALSPLEQKVLDKLLKRLEEQTPAGQPQSRSYTQASQKSSPEAVSAVTESLGQVQIEGEISQSPSNCLAVRSVRCQEEGVSMQPVSSEDEEVAPPSPESADWPHLPYGIRIMRKQGWRPGQGLGPRKQGIKEPIDNSHLVKAHEPDTRPSFADYSDEIVRQEQIAEQKQREARRVWREHQLAQECAQDRSYWSYD